MLDSKQRDLADDNQDSDDDIGIIKLNLEFETLSGLQKNSHLEQLSFFAKFRLFSF